MHKDSSLRLLLGFSFQKIVLTIFDARYGEYKKVEHKTKKRNDLNRCSNN